MSDDFADDPAVARQSNMLHTLYITCRPNVIRTTSAIKKFNALHAIIRVHATELFVYRLRHIKDIDTFIHKVTVVVENMP